MNTIKLLITVLLLSVSAEHLLARQDHVFVLVDVSGSIKSVPHREEAKIVVRELIEGKFDRQRFRDWDPKNIADQKLLNIFNGKSTPLIGIDSWVFIVPFGNKDTYKQYTSTLIRAYPSDFEQFYDAKYPTAFHDRLTYIGIAKAYSAELARQKSLSSYYVIMITDLLGHQDDTQSKPSQYSTYETDLLDAYNTTTSAERGVGVIRTSWHKDFRIEMYRVSIQNIPFPQNPNVPPSPTGTTLIPELVMLNPRGTKPVPTKYETNTIAVSWQCNNCPPGVKFRIAIAGDEQGNREIRTVQDNLQGVSTNVELPKSGRYRIVLSSSNNLTRAAFFEIISDRHVWLLILFLFAAAGCGYYLWNRKRNTVTSTKMKKNHSGEQTQSEQSDHYY